MKKLCRYSIIDVETAFLLACGQKWKDFENSPFRCVKDDTFRSSFFPWHKITTYFREIEIKGRRCVIVYYLDENAKKGESYNIVTYRGIFLFKLRGSYYDSDKEDYCTLYRQVLDCLGVSKYGA